MKNSVIMKNQMKSIFMLIAGFFFFQTGYAQNNYSVELTFVDHLKAGLIEQDVYVQKEGKGKKVYRILPEEREAYLDAEVFATKKMVYHHPFDRSLAGPYKRGESIGLTLNEWLQAKGSATCSCEDGWGAIEASFENLVPNATYTMWHAFMAKDNVENFLGTFDLPLGDRDGSQSVFTTDSNGNAEIDLRFENCLQLAETQLASMMAIAYHSDGKTYGIQPGPFGQVTHVQLFAFLPEADDVEDQISEEQTQQVGEKK